MDQLQGQFNNKNFKLNRSFNYVWGMKQFGTLFKAKKENISPVYLEDGFIHSFGYSKKKNSFFYLFDKNGIYYDCNSKSDLFKYLKDDLMKKI